MLAYCEYAARSICDHLLLSRVSCVLSYVLLLHTCVHVVSSLSVIIIVIVITLHVNDDIHGDMRGDDRLALLYCFGFRRSARNSMQYPPSTSSMSRACVAAPHETSDSHHADFDYTRHGSSTIYTALP